MSLNHSKYLRTLPSEVRQVAKFHSVSVQVQIDEIREHIRDLYDMVERLISLHEMEHGVIRDPITGELIQSDQPTTTAEITKPKKDHHPYL